MKSYFKLLDRDVVSGRMNFPKKEICRVIRFQQEFFLLLWKQLQKESSLHMNYSEEAKFW